MGFLETLPHHKLATKCSLHYSPVSRRPQPMTGQEVNAAIRDSLGLPPKPEPQPTFPQEGHVSEFPYWSFRPTVSLGVTCAVVCTYGCDNGRIAPTRCAMCDKKSLE